MLPDSKLTSAVINEVNEDGTNAWYSTVDVSVKNDSLWKQCQLIWVYVQNCQNGFDRATIKRQRRAGFLSHTYNLTCWPKKNTSY